LFHFCRAIDIYFYLLFFLFATEFTNDVETQGRALGNLHYDCPVTLKGGKKERQDRWCEYQD
jgi:hypothetical protein